MDDLWQIVIVSFFVGIGSGAGTEFTKYAIIRLKDHKIVKKIVEATGV